MLGGLSIRTASLILSSVSWLFFGTTILWKSACFGPLVVGFRTTWGDISRRSVSVSFCLAQNRVNDETSTFNATPVVKLFTQPSGRKAVWAWTHTTSLHLQCVVNMGVIPPSILPPTAMEENYLLINSKTSQEHRRFFFAENLQRPIVIENESEKSA